MELFCVQANSLVYHLQATVAAFRTVVFSLFFAGVEPQGNNPVV